MIAQILVFCCCWLLELRKCFKIIVCFCLHTPEVVVLLSLFGVHPHEVPHLCIKVLSGSRMADPVVTIFYLPL